MIATTLNERRPASPQVSTTIVNAFSTHTYPGIVQLRTSCSLACLTGRGDKEAEEG